jgi:hypothetical protein
VGGALLELPGFDPGFGVAGLDPGFGVSGLVDPGVVELGFVPGLVALGFVAPGFDGSGFVGVVLGEFVFGVPLGVSSGMVPVFGLVGFDPGVCVLLGLVGFDPGVPCGVVVLVGG